MRHLLLLPLMLGIASPAIADLGEAEMTEFQTRTFDVWIGFGNGVDRKNWNNSDLLPLLDFSTEHSYWE